MKFLNIMPFKLFFEQLQQTITSDHTVQVSWWYEHNCIKQMIQTISANLGSLHVHGNWQNTYHEPLQGKRVSMSLDTGGSHKVIYRYCDLFSRWNDSLCCVMTMKHVIYRLKQNVVLVGYSVSLVKKYIVCQKRILIVLQMKLTTRFLKLHLNT